MPDDAPIPPARALTIHVCGAALCRDGQPHDDLREVILYDGDARACGFSVACSRCGQSAMARDLLRLP
jgi:hypothetical protein